MPIHSATIEHIGKPPSPLTEFMNLASGWYLVLSFPVGGGWSQTKWIPLEKE